jgi:hypothetical protein
MTNPATRYVIETHTGVCRGEEHCNPVEPSSQEPHVLKDVKQKWPRD